jgi:glycerophosphoryl diester phosphodiesterase
MTPLLIAHRGDVANFPENSIEAFESAFEKGVDGVEFDVQLVDGELLVVHDYQFDASQAYPVLRDVIKKIAAKGRLEIELKSYSTHILSLLKNLLLEYSSDDIELTTAELAMVHPIKEMFPQVNVGVIFGTNHFQPWMEEKTLIRKTLELMQTMNAQVAHLSVLPLNMLTKDLIDNLHQNRILVSSHIPKDAIEKQVKLYKNLKDLSVDQVTFEDFVLLDMVRNRF